MELSTQISIIMLRELVRQQNFNKRF